MNRYAKNSGAAAAVFCNLREKKNSWCGQNDPPSGRRLNAYFDSHFSSTGSQQQQEKWDGRPNSPVVSANCDMNLIPVFNGHVRNVGEVSTYGSSKLKTFNAQGKRVFICKCTRLIITLENAVFLRLFSTEFPRTGKGEPFAS